MDEYQQANLESLYITDDPLGFFKNSAGKFLSLPNAEISSRYLKVSVVAFVGSAEVRPQQTPFCAVLYRTKQS